MPNSEWWWEKYNKSGSASFMEKAGFYLGIEEINQLLAEHRELIVKEIRVEIDGLWSGDNLLLQQDMATTLRRAAFEDTKEAILSLPCLKENE